MSTDWHDAAACTGSNADLFFPERGADQRPAKAICARCPVRLGCLEWAIANGEDSGIWGGMNEDDRRKERRRRRYAKATHGCPFTVAAKTTGADRHYDRGQKPCDACTREQVIYHRRRRAALGKKPRRNVPAEPLRRILASRDRSISSMGDTIKQAVRRGRLSIDAAAKAADELGLHPVEIWDDWDGVAEVAA